MNKLRYWSSLFSASHHRQLSLLVDNLVFIHLWRGSDKVIHLIRGTVRNFL
jgi:hypothetical protein